MFKTVAILFAFAAVTATVTAGTNNQEFRQTNNKPHILGGYSDAKVTSADVEMLQIAISSAEHKAYTGNSICIKHVDALQTQVVAGTNYKFSVNGCRLARDQYMGYCKDQVRCRRSQFDVVVYKGFTDTLNVTSITRTQ